MAKKPDATQRKRTRRRPKTAERSQAEDVLQSIFRLESDEARKLGILLYHYAVIDCVADRNPPHPLEKEMLANVPVDNPAARLVVRTLSSEFVKSFKPDDSLHDTVTEVGFKMTNLHLISGIPMLREMEARLRARHPSRRNVERDRGWYEQFISGASYSEIIAQVREKEPEPVTDISIKVAIRRAAKFYGFKNPTEARKDFQSQSQRTRPLLVPPRVHPGVFNT